jgi:hypothetical protein
MPHLNIPFSAGSPIIDLFVGVSQQRRDALLAVGRSIPNFQRARALIDTGASGTCIDPTILKPLGLTATELLRFTLHRHLGLRFSVNNLMSHLESNIQPKIRCSC